MDQKYIDVANKVMQQIVALNPHISPVTKQDIPLFRKFFLKEPHTYGNAWLYITQHMNRIGPQGLGYKYYDKKSLIPLCVYPKVDNPNILAGYFIRPMGKNAIQTIIKLSQQIQKKIPIPFYAKKIFEDQKKVLLANGFTDINVFPWSKVAPEEDDVFPEKIIDIKYTNEKKLTLSRKRHLRRTYFNVKKISKENKIKIYSVDKKQQIAWAITQEFFNTIKSKDKKNISNSYDYFNMIWGPIDKTNTIRLLAYINNIALGYVCIEIQNQDYASLYATIFLRNKCKYLGDYLMLYAFDLLEKRGIRFFNLGGSEHKQLDDYKNKFLPHYSLKMPWVVKTPSSYLGNNCQIR